MRPSTGVGRTRHPLLTLELLHLLAEGVLRELPLLGRLTRPVPPVEVAGVEDGRAFLFERDAKRGAKVGRVKGLDREDIVLPVRIRFEERELWGIEGAATFSGWLMLRMEVVCLRS